MANKINGDFDQDSIEAFRAAYAAQMQTPEDQEIDEYTRLPTNVVANTSPWIQHTGLWKANPGNRVDFVPNQTLEAPEPEEEDEISEEEIDNLVNELLSSSSEEDSEGEEDEDLEEIIRNFLAEDGEEIEEDLDSILDQLLSDDSEEDGDTEEVVAEETELSEEEIDELIDSLQQEIEDSLQG